MKGDVDGWRTNRPVNGAQRPMIHALCFANDISRRKVDVGLIIAERLVFDGRNDEGNSTIRSRNPFHLYEPTSRYPEKVIIARINFVDRFIIGPRSTYFPREAAWPIVRRVLRNMV